MTSQVTALLTHALSASFEQGAFTRHAVCEADVPIEIVSAGIVTEVGPPVTKFTVGDRVTIAACGDQER